MGQGKTYKEAFAEAETFEVIGVVASEAVAFKASENGVSFDTLYQAKNAQGNVIGYIVSVISSEGYGGNIGLYVGIQMDGTIKGVSILEINETVGLGMEAGKVLAPQYEGKNVKEFLYTKTGAKEANEVDAISGATITTKAINNAVNMALNMFWNDLNEAGGENHE